MKRLDDPAIAALEMEVDHYYDHLDLPSESNSLSRWYLTTVIEDALRLNATSFEATPDFSLLQHLYNISVMSDTMKYVYKYALLLIDKRLPPDRLFNRPNAISGPAYKTTHSIIDAFAKYDGIVRSFASCHENRGGCYLLDDNSLLFQNDNDDRLYDVLDFYASSVGKGVSLHSFFTMCSYQGIDDLPSEMIKAIRSTRFDKSGVAIYKFRVKTAVELDNYIIRLSPSEAFVPREWNFPWGSADIVTRVLRAIQIRCLYHLLCVHFGAMQQGVEGIGVEGLALIVRTPEFVQDIADFVNEKKAKVQRIVDYLIYGTKVNTPDPALQPVIPIGGRKSLLSCFNICSSFAERNILSLHARVDPQSFNHASSIFENKMTAKIAEALELAKLTHLTNRRIRGEEIDVLIVSPLERIILALELRWMLPAGDPREVSNRREECRRKIRQISRKVGVLSNNKREILRQFDIEEIDLDTWVVYGFLVTEGFAGTIAGFEVGHPVVPVSVLLYGLSTQPALSHLSRWILSGKWLPQENIHFESDLLSISFGKHTASTRGVLIKSSNDTFWSDYIRQSLISFEE